MALSLVAIRANLENHFLPVPPRIPPKKLAALIVFHWNVPKMSSLTSPSLSVLRSNKKYALYLCILLHRFFKSGFKEKTTIGLQLPAMVRGNFGWQRLSKEHILPLIDTFMFRVVQNYMRVFWWSGRTPLLFLASFLPAFTKFLTLFKTSF